MVVTLPGLDREARDHDPSRPPRHNRSGGRAQPHRRPGNARSSHPSRLVARRSEVDGGRPGWLAPAGRTPQRVRAPSLAAAAVGMAALGWTGGLGPALPTLAAGAAPAVHCSTGVVVVADFAPWGGDINSVCDATLPANASEALVAARFHPTGVAAYGGLNFICQIAGDPPHVTCASTPPANAYWSFWYADAGSDTWTYSPLGPESLEPRAGSVEAWVFGSNTGAGPPASFPSPNALRTATGRASGTTTTSTQPASSPTSSPSATTPAGAPATTAAPAPPAGAGGNGRTPDAATAAKTPATPAGGAASTTRRTKPSPSTGTGAGTGGSRRGTDARTPPDRKASIPKIVDAAPAMAAQQPQGSPLPFAINAAAVAALAAGAGLIAWRRRRTGSP